VYLLDILVTGTKLEPTEDDPNYWNPEGDSTKLTGAFIDGTLIEVTDSMCIVPLNKKNQNSDWHDQLMVMPFSIYNSWLFKAQSVRCYLLCMFTFKNSTNLHYVDDI
jgi:hypothetical protein